MIKLTANLSLLATVARSADAAFIAIPRDDSLQTPFKSVPMPERLQMKRLSKSEMGKLVHGTSHILHLTHANYALLTLHT